MKYILKLTLVFSLVLILVAAGCGPATAPAPTAPPPSEATPAPPAATPVPPTAAPAVKENVFVYAHGPTFPDIDPSVSFSNDSVVMGNAYETLVFYNPPGSEGVLSPQLATSWESSEDGMTWTFKLREGVKFHDGTDFNAEAVKYSVDRTMTLGLGLLSSGTRWRK